MQASAPSIDFPCFSAAEAPLLPLDYCRFAKTFLDNLSHQQIAALCADFPVAAWIAHRSEQIDRILQGLHVRYPQRDSISLIAIGGYGRAELFPHSDIDLLILCPEGQQSQAEDFIRLLWNLGIDIAHSVRSLSQCRQDLAADHSFLTALLEQRFLCGDAELAAHIRRLPPTTAEQKGFRAAKLNEQKQRDARQISLGRLEPNIKTDPGGLRDIHMIGWVQRYCLGQQNWQELLRPAEYRQLMDSRDILWRIRFSLHLCIKRPKDVLTFEAQKQLAAQFGFKGELAIAVQEFMRLYYISALHIRRLNRLAIKLCDEALNSPVLIQSLDADFILRNQRLALKNPQKLSAEPAFVWQIFLRLLARPDIDSLSPQLGRQLREEYAQYFMLEQDMQSHAAFLQLLSQDGNLYREIRRIHRYGLLSRYLPPFRYIVGQMQYDLLHEYTVDQHSLRLFYFLDLFKQSCPQYPEAQSIMHSLERPAILYLAALLHDIGKGRQGDHSQIGADIAADYAAHNPCLSTEEGELLVFLVRQHLQLSLTAQKKDLSNPQIIADFAALFPRPEYLDYLYLLTLADISATNGRLWNSWRAGLMHNLYRLTREHLQTKHPSHDRHIQQLQAAALALAPQQAADLKQLWTTLPAAFFSNESPAIILAKSRALLNPEEENTVIALDSPNQRLFIAAKQPPDIVFAHTSHYLEKEGFDIAEARLYRQNHAQARTLQQYSLNGQTPLNAAMIQALKNSIQSDAPPQAPSPRLNNPALKHFTAAPRISFRHHAPHSEMELICTDRHGLLSLISRVLLEQHIHLSHAKIATFGERVEDSFYLSDRHGNALDAPAAEALRRRLLQLLE